MRPSRRFCPICLTTPCLGLVADYGVVPESLPCRKTRRSEQNPQMALTNAQLADNRGRARIKVEHAISGAKRLG